MWNLTREERADGIAICDNAQQKLQDYIAYLNVLSGILRRVQ